LEGEVDYWIPIGAYILSISQYHASYLIYSAVYVGAMSGTRDFGSFLPKKLAMKNWVC
jgi:hypothetical protein